MIQGLAGTVKDKVRRESAFQGQRTDNTHTELGKLIVDDVGSSISSMRQDHHNELINELHPLRGAKLRDVFPVLGYWSKEEPDSHAGHSENMSPPQMITSQATIQTSQHNSPRYREQSNTHHRQRERDIERQSLPAPRVSNATSLGHKHTNSEQRDREPAFAKKKTMLDEATGRISDIGRKSVKHVEHLNK